LNYLSPAAIAPEYLRLYRRLVDSRRAVKALAGETARPEKGKSMETKAAV
jgi:hypothetical protein